jgi:site-specific DNA-cytosine methylase
MRYTLIILILIAGCSRPISRPVLKAEKGLPSPAEGVKKADLQKRWQRMKKLQVSYMKYKYWLSADPNMRAGDLNFDGIINFYDYANILSLCTGYGGLELGLARALEGVFRVVAVEVEAYALACLAQKAQEGKLAIEAMWPDLKTFPAERFRGCFDFVLAGYPCQPFSVAGKRKGTEDERHLWPYIAGIVQAVEPVWCFFENVSNHLNLGYPTVYGSLRDMGYSVEAGLVSANECLAPHQRLRLFILAYCESYSYRRWVINGNSNKKRVQESQQSRFNTTGRGRRSSQLANTTAQRIQGAEPKGAAQTGGQIEQYGWPSRPGQPQYEWEEPRTITMVNTNSRRLEGASAKEQGRDNALCASGREEPRVVEKSTTRRTGNKSGAVKGRKRSSKIRQGNRQVGSIQHNTASEGQAQSRLGRAVDGASCRVDRLRLLGNGVVPQQAEKAFRYLMEQMNAGM